MDIFYPIVVATATISILMAKRKHWLWGMTFLLLVGFSAAMEYQCIRLQEKYFIEAIQRVLIDGVIEPGETEKGAVYDDLWAGEKVDREEGIRYEILLEKPEVCRI